MNLRSIAIPVVIVIGASSALGAGWVTNGWVLFGDTERIQSNVTMSPNVEVANDAPDDRAGYFTGTKSRAGANVQDNDQLINIVGKGMVDGVLQPSGDISIYADKAPSGGKLGTKIYLNTSSVAQPLGVLGQWFEYDGSAHIGNHQEQSPTLSACGTSSNLRSGSSDTVGAITGGVGSTSCKLNFRLPYRMTPFCLVSPNYPVSLGYTVTTTGITFTYPLTYYGEITYQCWDSSNP